MKNESKKQVQNVDKSDEKLLLSDVIGSLPTDEICDGCKVNLTELERNNRATGRQTTCDCGSY